MKLEVFLSIQALSDKIDTNKEQEKEFKYSTKIGFNIQEMRKYIQNLTHLKIEEH
jgi:hypothetical protein